MNQDDLLRLLRERVKAAGSVSRFANEHNLAESYVGNVLYCGVKPGPKIALALGLKKVVSFEPIN